MNTGEIVFGGLEQLQLELVRFAKAAPADALPVEQLREIFKAFTEAVRELPDPEDGIIKFRKVVLDDIPGLESEMQGLKEALTTKGFRGM